jgi:hypothetical protein
MKSRVLLTVLTVAVLLAWGTAVWAEASGGNRISEIKIWGGLSEKPKTSDKYQPSRADIGIGSFGMFTIHRPAAGFSIAEREVVVYNRLVEILSQGPVNPGAVHVRKVRSAPTVYVGRYRLVSVYRQDAKAAGVACQAGLACKWSKSIANALPQVAPANAVSRAGATGTNVSVKP